MPEALMCAECGHGELSVLGHVHCTYCGSELIILAEKPPAVVQYEETR